VYQIIQDLVMDSNLSSKKQSKTEGSLQSREKKFDQITKSLGSANQEIKGLKVLQSNVLIE